MRWFRFYDDALDDPKVQRLSGKAYKAALIEALAGNETPFSRYLRPDNGRPPAKEWAALRSAVFNRDDFTCQYCGARGGRLECDHVTPVSRGGSNAPSNLKTACRPCNRAKRDMTPEEWAPA